MTTLTLSSFGCPINVQNAFVHVTKMYFEVSAFHPLRCSKWLARKISWLVSQSIWYTDIMQHKSKNKHKRTCLFLPISNFQPPWLVVCTIGTGDQLSVCLRSRKPCFQVILLCSSIIQSTRNNRHNLKRDV